MTVTISVTEDHIAEKCHNGGKCPVSLAVQEALLPRGFSYIWVTAYTIRLDPHSEDPHINLPPEACNWIRSYDSGNIVRPFSFQVEVPA